MLNDLSDDADNDLTIYERFIELKQLKRVSHNKELSSLLYTFG